MLLRNPQTPDVYPIGYYESFDLYLWILRIILGFIAFYIFLNRSKNSQIDTQKDLFKGFAYLMFFLSLMQLFFILSVDLNVNYDHFVTYGYIFQMLAFTSLLIYSERNIFKKTKGIFTIISTTGAVLGVISLFDIINRDLIRIGSFLISTLITFVIVLLFVKIIIESGGAVRKRSIIGFVGIIILFVGSTLDSEMFYGLVPDLPLIIPPILSLTGLVILVANQRLE